VLTKKKIDFFVFGHRHLPIDYRLPYPLSTLGRGGKVGEARYVNLGDWIHYYTYAVFDGTNLELKSYKGKENKIIRN
jgi:UDP-2,3-diacylglucosamine hydrolase